MRRIAITLTAILLAFVSALAAQSLPTPDFAFPLKVEADAQKRLAEALKSADGEATVRSLIDLGLAKSAVSTDSLPAVISRIEEVTAQCQSSTTASLLQLLLAQVYRDIYLQRQYDFDSRQSFGETPSADYNLWSRADFLAKITGLTADALAPAAALQQTPITSYAAATNVDRTLTRYYPTLFDFASYCSIGLLKTFLVDEPAVSPRMLLNAGPIRLVGHDGVDTRILDVYNGLVSFHTLRDDAPALVMSLVLRSQYLAGPSRDFGSKNLDQSFDVLMRLYADYAFTDASVEFILPLASKNLDQQRKATLYKALTDFAKSRKHYFRIDQVKDALAHLGCPSVSLRIPPCVGKDFEFEISADVANVNRLEVEVYLLSPDATDLISNYYSPAGGRISGQMVDKLSLNADGAIPFATTLRSSYSLPDYGRYIFVPVFGGNSTSKTARSYPIVSCSDISTQVTPFANQTIAWAINPADGAPVEDASMRVFDWRDRQVAKSLPTPTDADGSTVLTGEYSGQIQAYKGADRFSPTVGFSSERRTADRQRLCASLLTGLKLYHLGDTVRWTAIAYSIEGRDRRLLEGRRLRLQLLDANFRHVDSVGFLTDDWGRAAGAMPLPAAGLTGDFHLRVFAGKDVIGNCSFTVSDYKLPTFQLIPDPVERPASSTDTVMITGTVATFFGFPLADSQVSATITNTSSLWSWHRSEAPVATLTAVTDPDGRFRIALPPQAIADAQWPDGLFIISLAATSPAGETQSAETCYVPGKSIELAANIPDSFEVGSSNASVRAISASHLFAEAPDSGPDLVVPLAYSLTNVHTGSVSSGECSSGSVGSIFEALPSATYRARFWSTDTARVAADTIARRVVVFRPSDTAAPVDSLLWLPSSSVVADSSRVASILFSTTASDAHIQLLVTDDANRLVRKEWLTPAPGMHRLSVEIPEGSEKATVYLYTVKNFQACQAEIAVKSLASENRLKLKVETFRNRAIPGSLETITLRSVYSDDSPAPSAMMVDISNKAIDQLQPNLFAFNPLQASPMHMYRCGGLFGSVRDDLCGSASHFFPSSIPVPAFNLYDLNFCPANYLRGRGPRMYSANKVASTVFSEKAEAEECVSNLADSAPLASEVASADTGSASPEEPEATGRSYRPAEVPLALFSPLLTSDADGRVSITYRVPDANTTWFLQALAYDRSLLSDYAKADILAFKPLTVSINVPRFLRTADSLTLQAMVMNSADSTLTASMRLEAVNPADGRVLASTDSVGSLVSNGSATIALRFDVPADLPLVAIRASADSPFAADGEQVLLPILASEQAIIESDVFYIAPSCRRFAMEIEPPLPADKVYLQFTENPTWEVVSALPGLRQGQVKSSVSAAAAIFSAGVAMGLSQANPEIERFLRRLLAEDPKSALEKNPDLRTLLLDATPWMAEALDDTQRLQRLALILDRRSAQSAVAENIHLLAKTQASGGGWAWTAAYPEVSQWATYNVLSTLGQLRRMGFLPDDRSLLDMLRNAVSYLDAAVAKDFARNPGGDFSRFVLLRNYFSDIKMSTATQRVVSATIQRIIGSWTDASLTDKAVYALILNANGYAATAANIVESLRQYATSSPERGMWWQQLDNCCFWSMGKEGATALILDAFAAVGAPEVDAIRQWLILQKTATDWGTSLTTSRVIASILTCGSRWTVNPAGTAIRVGSHLIADSPADKATGLTHTDITSLLSTVSDTPLTIDRQANYPSYGSIVRTGLRPMDSVVAKGCDGLEVEKHITVERDGRWVEAAPAVGDRVKVSLTLRVGRDLDYVAITDPRPAGLEPAEQLPRPIFADGLCFYRENRDSFTSIFIDHLPSGTYILSYDLWASQAGTFSSGVATAQSQYNPLFTAHSSGQILAIE